MARTLERRSGDTRENRVPARARRAVSAVPGLLCALLFFGTGTARGGGSAVPQEAAPGTAPPLCFVANRGQSGRGVDYYVREGASTVSFARGGVTFFLSEERRQQRWALKLDFVGAEPTSPVGEDRNASEASGVGDTCGRLVYRNLWPGIDLVYTGDEGRLKYSFVIRPGADPGRIELAYRGATAVRTTSDGRLAVSTPAGRLEEERPYAYQEAGGERLEVKAAFALGGDGPSDTRFGFRVGSYDRSRPLILDPVIKLIGFETRDASEIVSLGAGAAINNTTLRAGSGQRSLQQSTTATVLASGIAPALSTLGLRFSFLKPSNPGANQSLVELMAGATNQWALQLTTSGRLQVLDQAGLTFVGTTVGSTVLANATWYTVRLAYNAASGGVLQVWLDGSLEISVTHSTAGTAVDQVQVLAAAALYTYDDFYLTDTATQPPLGQIVRIRVSGPGYRSDFDTVVAATTRETNVNENTPSDANYNGHAAATVATDLYALQSSPAGTINAVKGMWRMSGSAIAVGGTHDYAWRVQGIEASQAFTGLGAAWTLMEVVWSTPPGVGGAWTQAEVDGLELGARHNGTHAEDTYISWAAAMVDYDASGAAGAVTCSGAARKPWYNASWRYRKAILVDHTKVVGDLVDFPLLVSRSGDADLAANARADGFDILFTDEDGTTKLSHQREAYDGAGNLVAWVKVPLLPTGADKVIFMYYGNPSSPDQQSANATWSNGYRAVWHLSEASGSGAYIRNSALNNYNGTPDNTAFNASGKIDGARTFSNVGYSNVAISNSAALFNAWSQFSFEVWIYPDYASDAIWQAAGEDEFLYGNTGPVRLGRVRREGSEPAGDGTLQVDVQFNTGLPPDPTTYVTGPVHGRAWNHVVYTYQGSDYQVFFNGVEEYRDVFPDDRLSAASYILLGIDSNAGSLNGSLDEVRISNAGRSAEWIQTEYANQNAPATFCSVCGAQDVATTAVGLASFTARGFESAVLLEWETASELDNLGFHLYRGVSADGPWTKLNASMIPGLGSSPEGKQYRYVDAGLANGTTYFYRLEDVDRHGRITSHGPVSATPLAGVAEPGEGGGSEGPAGPPHSPTPKPAPERKTHGDPTQQSLRVLERTAFGVTLELVTGGFYSQEQEDGTSKLLVPGFFDRAEPGLPTVPTRRLWTDAVVGRGVELVSVEPSDLVSFSGLDVSLAGRPVAVAASDGTYRASSIPVKPGAGAAASGLLPASLALVHETAFQGERKKAYVELAPLRVDEASGDIVLARRLVVRLAFTGRVEGETGRGSLGRRAPGPVASGATGTQVLARLATRSRGVHTVAFEEIPGLAAPVSASDLRLSRLGAPVAFHLEPRSGPFGPGSVLYFLAEGTDSAYANEAVYELATGPGGIQMPGMVPTRRPRPSAALPLLRHERSFETDANYLPALLEARDLWVWDYGLAGGQGASYPFTLASPVLAPETAGLTVDLQGGSDTETDPDHHVLAFVNGSLVGEIRFDGMVPATLAVDLPSSLLLEGENTLRLENAGDTGSTASFVYLDRFSIEAPQEIAPVAGVLEGRAAQPGRATLDVAPGSVVLDVTGAVPRFLGRALADGRLAWNAETDHRYLAVLPEAFLKPEVRPAPSATLRSPANQADWILVAPEALLPAAQPLVSLRESQGLTARAVSLEAIVDEFGYGEAGPHALRGFLAFAFHDWQAPSPRYVLLLGDASYDPKGRLTGTSRPDLIPSPLTKSTFLWTPSDPLYAAVNGQDALPDIAIGRINAGTLGEAETAVQKILDFEASGQSLAGKATLVADNPDLAGDFEANQDDIATLLPSRTVEKLFLTQLGAAGTKAAVRSAFDSGRSLMSYVGHGSSGLWASEGILRSPDVASFAPQPQQPLVLAMTCSNGYFLSPFNNSLAERLVLADHRGAIAAFAPSGLSLDDAAHVYHRAVVSELENGNHERLGDLVLAAQAQYAASGAFPELLDIYNLLGDPGLRIR